MPGLTRKQILIYLRLPSNADIRDASRKYQEDYLHLDTSEMRLYTMAQLKTAIEQRLLNSGNYHHIEGNNGNQILVPTTEYANQIAALNPYHDVLPEIAFYYNPFTRKKLRVPIPSNRRFVIGMHIEATISWKTVHAFDNTPPGEVNINQDINYYLNSHQLLIFSGITKFRQWEGSQWKTIIDGLRARYGLGTYIQFTAEAWNVEWSFQQAIVGGFDIMDTPLRFTFYGLSDSPNRHWDSKSGQCVIDFLHYRFGNVPRLKKTMTIENLTSELQNLAGSHNVMEGISANVIVSFCREHHISVHIIDVYASKIYAYVAERNSSLGSIAFKIANDHINPFEEPSQIRSISMKKVYDPEDRQFSRLYFEQKMKKSDFFEKTKIEFLNSESNQDVFDSEKTFWGLSAKDQLVAEIIKRKEIPSPYYNIRSYQGEVQYVKFKDNNIVYIDDKQIAAKDIYDYFQFKNQTWNGENMYTIIKDIFEEYDLRYSVMGHISEVFFSKFRTDRIHSGYYDEGFYDYKQSLRHHPYREDSFEYMYTSIDIKKCYTHCADDFPFKWNFLDVYSQWEIFEEGENIDEYHMYQVETEDIQIFKGPGVYTYVAVKEGLDEGIIDQDDIVRKLECGTENNDYIKKLIERVRNYADLSYPRATELKKKLVNVLIGLFGSYEKKKQAMFVTTSDNDIIHYQQKYGHKFQTHKYQKYGLQVVSSRQKYHTYRNNIPLNMQVIDYSNVLLYRLMKQIPYQYKVVYRYTDCIYIKHKKDQLNLDIQNMGDKPGQYYIDSTYSRDQFINRVEHMNSFMERPNQHECPGYEPAESVDSDSELESEDEDENVSQLSTNIIRETNRRNTIKRLKTYIHNIMSFMIYGRAGTGKTYLLENTIKGVLDSYDCKYAVLSYTNVACGLIDGKTLHTYFGVKNDKCQLNQAQLSKIDNNIDYIIIDEISMVTKQFWSIFYQIKKQTKCQFIFLGDYRQCPPPDNTKISMLDTDTCYHIIDNNIIELTEVKRYCQDGKLYNLLEDVWNQKASQSYIQNELQCIDYIDETHNHICYTNKTRRKVNIKINNMQNAYQEIIPKVRMYEIEKNIKGNVIKEPVFVDVKMYKGINLISRKNNKKIDAFNNEIYTVTDITDNDVVLKSQRRSSKEEEKQQGKFKDHIISMSKQELFTQFELSYCMTVYKWQGKTIKDTSVTIHDLHYLMKDRRYIYTALSRVEDFKQLHLYSQLSY